MTQALWGQRGLPQTVDVAIRSLSCSAVFTQLTPQERLYAHYLSKAAWAGAEITQRQVSPESPTIFQLALELHRSCDGDWARLLASPDDEKSRNELDRFLTYLALVLYNMGNYYGYGDQKFVPSVSEEFIRHVAAKSSSKARDLLEECLPAMLSPHPSGLGFPSEDRQSAYYLGSRNLNHSDIKAVDKLLALHGMGPDNTRLRVSGTDPEPNSFEVLQASVEVSESNVVGKLESGAAVSLRNGSFSHELNTVCKYLREAIKHAATDTQKDMLRAYIRHFETGHMNHFRDSQKAWLKDKDPRVELILGFVEPYRDPAGSRAEFEGIVAIESPVASDRLPRLVSGSREFIRELPWILSSPSSGSLGPFESCDIEPPDTGLFSEDIRDTCGFKNIMIANRNRPPNLDLVDAEKEAPIVAVEEAREYLSHEYYSSEIRIAVHELLGHGTGNRLLRETADGSFNFDRDTPPVDPLTHEPIRTWYKDNETVSSVFGSLGLTLDECRADGIGLFLLSNKALLATFGYDDSSERKADDLIYSAYLSTAVHGLEALLSYDVEKKVRALLSAPGFVRVDVDVPSLRVTVHIDRAKTLTHGRKALGELLLKLHIWRVTANVAAFREFLDSAAAVDDYWLGVRSVVQARKIGSRMFVQGNTFLCADGQDALYCEYPESPEGLIKTWVERVADI
ncbi:peptidase family M49-domain-containing protein [Lasiosphaeria ovina]|uniref:Peptidase family M49-domain-containing protein n=1 Tax=Lasiosphaeria ovina TaxID=92902 RepID=A0AAE0KL23_9PEZI|nr:peptidase family M49-domain-containing protein [Lasiosphaeria ovina]